MQDLDRYHRPLTAKQERFAYEYCLDGNAAAAARRAGYSSRKPNSAAKTGARLLQLPEVRAIVEEAYGRRKMIIDGQVGERTDQLKAQASLSLAEYLVIDHGGFLRLKLLSELSEAQAAELEQVDLLPDGTLRAIKLKDPTSAMLSLFRLAGIRPPIERDDHSHSAA